MHSCCIAAIRNHTIELLQIKLKNSDNNQLQRKQSQLIKRREQLYYRLGKYQQQYLSQLPFQQTYQRQKQANIIEYSDKKAKEYGDIIDRQKGTALKLSEYNVYKRVMNPQNSGSRRKISVVDALARQAQFKQTNISRILFALKKKKLVAQYYLLDQFYERYHMALIELKLDQLLRLDVLAESTEKGDNRDEIQMKAKIEEKTLRLSIKKCPNFPIRQQRVYRIDYQDDAYLYCLQANPGTQIGREAIFNEQSLTKLAQICGKDKSFKILIDSGFLITSQPFFIYFNRFRKPVKLDSVSSIPTTTCLIMGNQYHIKQSIKSSWKGKRNMASSDPFNYGLCEVTLILESNHTKEIICQTQTAYFVGINGIITSPVKRKDASLLGSWGCTQGSSRYLRICQWVDGNVFSIGMFEIMNEVYKQSLGYLGLGMFEEDSEVKSKELQGFHQKFQASLGLSICRRQGQLPFISAKSEEQLYQIRKALSLLSNFQIFNEEVVITITDRINQEIINAYNSRKEFEEKFQNQAQFKRALEGNKDFFVRRNQAIQAYRSILQLHQDLSHIVKDYKDYSNVDLQGQIRQKLLAKYHQQFNLQPLTMSNDQRDRQLNIKSYQLNQHLSGQLALIMCQKQRLEQEKCIIEAHILQRFIHDMISSKNTEESLQKVLYITDKKLQEVKFTEDNIPFYQNSTQFKLPKVTFHNILDESQTQKKKLSQQVRFQNQLQKAVTELLGFDQAQYERLVEGILNQPISYNQKYRSINILLQLYQFVKMDRPLSGKEAYMKYLFHIFSSIKMQYCDHEYTLLDNRQHNSNQSLNDNEIKSKLTLMQLINNYASKQTVESYTIQMDIPKDQKLEIIDFHQYIRKKLQESIKKEEICKITYLKKKIKSFQQNKIKLFIKSLQKPPQRFNSKKIAIHPTDTVMKGFISLEDFDYRFNYTYKSTQGRKMVQMRGGFPFYQASKCTKLALKVLGKYEDGDSWVKNDHNQGQHAIAYHALGQPLRSLKYTTPTSQQQEQFKIPKIWKKHSNPVQQIIKRGLKQGPRQLHENSQCLLHENEPNVGKGIYFSPSFELVFRLYASKEYSHVQIKQSFENEFKIIDGSPYTKILKDNMTKSVETAIQQMRLEKYSIIFMSRLKPEQIHIFDRTITQAAQQHQKHLYWVVNKWQHSRTYAVVLVMASQLGHYPPLRQQFGEDFYYQDYQQKIRSWINNRIFIPHQSEVAFRQEMAKRKRRQKAAKLAESKKKEKKEECVIY